MSEILVGQTKLKMGEDGEGNFLTFITFLTSGDDPSFLTPFILSSLLFFQPVGTLPYLLTHGTLLLALFGCKLIVNNDTGKVTHFSLH